MTDTPHNENILFAKSFQSFVASRGLNIGEQLDFSSGPDCMKWVGSYTLFKSAWRKDDKGVDREGWNQDGGSLDGNVCINVDEAGCFKLMHYQY